MRKEEERVNQKWAGQGSVASQQLDAHAPWGACTLYVYVVPLLTVYAVGYTTAAGGKEGGAARRALQYQTLTGGSSFYHITRRPQSQRGWVLAPQVKVRLLRGARGAVR